MQNRRTLQAAALALLTILAYLPALRAGFIWDDDYHVTRNFNLRSSEGLIQLWTHPGAVPQYYPLTHTTFWLEYHLWGLRPAGYHAINILLHAASAILLWIILRRLAIPGACFAAAIWAIHPVNVESVAWVTERKNVLSGVLYLAAMLTYLPLALDESIAPLSRKWWMRYSLTIVLFAGALLSKTVTASLPAAILLIVWWKRGRIEVRDVVPLLPMFALGLGMGYVTAHMEKEFVGAWGPEWNFSPADRLLIAGRAVWFYLWKLIAPMRLTFIYPRWTLQSDLPWQWILPIAAITLVAAAIAMRNKIGRGPAAALLFFGGTLVPALGFVNVFPMRYSFVADHFQYLASIGVIVLATAAVAGWLQRSVAVALGCLVVVVLGILTVRQTFIYHDLGALWRDTIAKDPHSWMARNNYADLLIQRGDLAEAQVQLRASLAENPRNPEALRNLGALFEAQGRPEDAINAYRDSLELRGDDRKSQVALGRVLISTGREREGLFYLNHALELYPDFAPAHEELARFLFARGKTVEAVEELRRAVALDPDSITARYHLAMVLIDQGQTDEGKQLLAELQRRHAVTQAAQPTQKSAPAQ